mgnify:CR=1 FL=1|tara:strand:- start:69 stop:569 length:501 start_codon:yes stop_codon:yes gene_type:complete
MLIKKWANAISSTELNIIFNTLKESKTIENDKALFNGKSSFTGEDSDILTPLGLKDKLQEKVDEYRIALGMPALTIINSWFAIQDIGGILKDHYHASSFLSAVLYINADENSNPLVFNVNNHKSTLYPTTGDLIMFPSWYKHGSDGKPNMTKDRTIISFNTCLINK